MLGIRYQVSKTSWLGREKEKGVWEYLRNLEKRNGAIKGAHSGIVIFCPLASGPRKGSSFCNGEILLTAAIGNTPPQLLQHLNLVRQILFISMTEVVLLQFSCGKPSAKKT